MVRGEGEQVFLNLVTAVDNGSFAQDRSSVRGIAYADATGSVIATAAEPTIEDLDRFNEETTIAQNKKAIQLLKDAGIVTEARFIVGLENETAETLEETYRMARDWNPDMANWAMYTPWPFSDLFQELGDKVEVFDFEKYNFVTPIMKPDAMERAELLDRVMNNCRRFFMNKTFLQYPWTRDTLRRKYLLGCLKAFMKSGFERTFYDLGRVGYWGPQTKKTVQFGFDANRKIDAHATAAAVGRIGPNSITRVAEALNRRFGRALTAELFGLAGISAYLDRPPTAMVDEAEARGDDACRFAVRW